MRPSAPPFLALTFLLLFLGPAGGQQAEYRELDLEVTEVSRPDVAAKAETTSTSWMPPVGILDASPTKWKPGDRRGPPTAPEWRTSPAKPPGRWKISSAHPGPR